MIRKFVSLGVLYLFATMPYVYSAASSSVPAKRLPVTSPEEYRLAQIRKVDAAFKKNLLKIPQLNASELGAFQQHFALLPESFKNQWLLDAMDKDNSFLVWTVLQHGVTINQDMLARIERYIQETKTNYPQDWLEWGLRNAELTIINAALAKEASFDPIDEETYNSFFKQADMCLKNEALKYAFNHDLMPMLHSALMNGAHGSILRPILSRKLIDASQDLKDTWLLMGCFYKETDILETALKHGANPNTRDNRGLPALFQVIHNPPAIRLLLEAGANPNIGAVIDDYDISPLIYALTGTPVIESIKLLLDFGANINDRTICISDHSLSGDTPLYLACGFDNDTQQSFSHLVTLLINRKANLNLCNNQELTPLTRSLYHRTSEIAWLLIQAGCDIYAQSNGRTPLIRALEYSILLAEDRDDLIENQTNYFTSIAGMQLQEDADLNTDLVLIIALLVERGQQLVQHAQATYPARHPKRISLQDKEEANIKQALFLAGKNKYVKSIIEDHKMRRAFIEETLPIGLHPENSYNRGFFEKTTCSFRELSCEGLSKYSILAVLRNREIGKFRPATCSVVTPGDSDIGTIRSGELCSTKPTRPATYGQSVYSPKLILPTCGETVTRLCDDEASSLPLSLHMENRSHASRMGVTPSSLAASVRSDLGSSTRTKFDPWPSRSSAAACSPLASPTTAPTATPADRTSSSSSSSTPAALAVAEPKEGKEERR